MILIEVFIRNKTKNITSSSLNKKNTRLHLLTDRITLLNKHYNNYISYF